MSMRYAADSRKRTVEGQVRCQIGRRAQISFDGFTVQVDDHEIRRLHIFVRNSARFDRHQSGLR